MGVAVDLILTNREKNAMGDIFIEVLQITELHTQNYPTLEMPLVTRDSMGIVREELSFQRSYGVKQGSLIVLLFAERGAGCLRILCMGEDGVV